MYSSNQLDVEVADSLHDDIRNVNAINIMISRRVGINQLICKIYVNTLISYLVILLTIHLLFNSSWYSPYSLWPITGIWVGVFLSRYIDEQLLKSPPLVTYQHQYHRQYKCQITTSVSSFWRIISLTICLVSIGIYLGGAFQYARHTNPYFIHLIAMEVIILYGSGILMVKLSSQTKQIFTFSEYENYDKLILVGLTMLIGLISMVMETADLFYWIYYSKTTYVFLLYFHSRMKKYTEKAEKMYDEEKVDALMMWDCAYIIH